MCVCGNNGVCVRGHLFLICDVTTVQMSGALLVGVTILTLYHESSIPIAPHESWLLLVLGLFLFCAALAGVFRLFFWRAGHRADYSFYVRMYLTCVFGTHNQKGEA